MENSRIASVIRHQKSMLYYSMMVILVMMIVNAFVMPYFQRASIEEVDYGTFMTMTENKEIEKVEFRSNDILFTDKEGKVYATGHMQDDGLVNRLYEAGAKFGSDIIPETSPMASFLLNWVLPIAIFGGLGYFMSKRLMDRAGGGASSMMFGMGKSNAKVYVKSTEGIRFRMWPARRKPRKTSWRSWNISIIPESTLKSARPCPREFCW